MIFYEDLEDNIIDQVVIILQVFQKSTKFMKF